MRAEKSLFSTPAQVLSGMGMMPAILPFRVCTLREERRGKEEGGKRKESRKKEERKKKVKRKI